MTIIVLSNKTINKIAAGEVLERPASAVKELVENAIDAGADKIEIRLEQSGKNLISISDNGIGMAEEDLKLAILRHATSKLDEDDLLNINSFGFRGEALPSIGAVSRMKITSCKAGNAKAYSINVEGGEISNTQVESRSQGTTVEVRDLFFATPARLKFLRTDKTELAAIVNVVKRISLSYPKIEFTLSNNGKELLRVRKNVGSLDEALEKRAIEIIGEDFIQNSSRVNFIQDDIEIYGFTSLPTYSRAIADDQFMFVNNRSIKDKVLGVALRVAYQDFMARDRFPVSVLFIKIPTRMVDVNVHPAKTEVRFYDPTSIRGMVISAIKNAINKTGHLTSSTTADQAISYMQQSVTKNSYGFSENAADSAATRFNIPNNNFKPEYKPSQITLFNRPDYKLATESLVDQPMINAPIARMEEVTEIDNSYPLGAAKAQLHGTYIISQTDDAIIIVDQHAAHERLGYEKIKLQIEKNGLLKQRLLIPEIVQLPDVERAELIADSASNLLDLGLRVERFDEKSVIVSELPSLVGEVNVAKLVQDIADHLHAMGENIALAELIEHVTETYACHYAIRAGRKLGAQEMNELLRQMEATPFSGQCNHGRPTYVKLKLADIEKLFGRK